MSKHEPGVYEPSSDDIRVFDGADDDFDEEGSRLPLLIVIALLVLAAFGGVVWLAYTQGVQRGRDVTPVIAAAKGPVRTAPANPGGQTPYAGLKIYEQPAPPEEESTPAQSAPPQETQPAEPAKPPQPEKTAKAPAAPPPKPVPAHTATVPAPVSTASTSGGAYVAQIGAYKTQELAASAWQAYQRKHPLVGGYAPDIKRVDLGDKGVWYRLRIGSFDSRASAGALCAKLSADGGACFPAKN